MKIKNFVKAIIVNEGKLLVTKSGDANGDYYLLPGGLQEYKETFHEALIRECIEEIGILVNVYDLVFIREYIGENHEFNEEDYDVHKVEYYFACEIVGNSTSKNGDLNDVNQGGVKWIHITEILNNRIYPLEMRKLLIDYIDGEDHPLYLGDIN